MEKSISLLPDEIKLKIYNDYFHPKHKFKEIINVLKTSECQHLYYKILMPHIKYMFLNDKILLHYMIKHGDNYNFNIVYENNVIKKKKMYTLFDDKFNSFALEWLMYVYH